MAGQIHGIYQSLDKKEKSLKELQKALANPKGKKRDRKDLEKKIRIITAGQYLKDGHSYVTSFSSSFKKG
jgi:hypothetical protein